METAVSSSQFRAAAASDAMASRPGTRHGSLEDFMDLSLLAENSHSDTAAAPQGAATMSRAHLQGAMQQVDKLQADIAGMEAVVQAVRGATACSFRAHEPEQTTHATSLRKTYRLL